MNSRNPYNQVCQLYLRWRLQSKLPELLDPTASASGRSQEDHDPGTDELLSIQLRRFFREEFGRIEPPADVFQRVLRAIAGGAELSKQMRRGCSPAPFNFARQIKRLTNGNVGRLTSGSITIALVLLVLSGSKTQIFTGGVLGVPYYTSSMVASKANFSNAAIQRTERGVMADQSIYNPLTGSDDVEIYDPVELHRGRIKHRSPFGTNPQSYTENERGGPGY